MTKRMRVKKDQAGTTSSAMASGSALVPPPSSGFDGSDRTNPAAPLVASKLLGDQVWAFDLSGIPKGLAKTLPIAVTLGTRAYPVRATERLHTEKFTGGIAPGIATDDFREFFLAKGNVNGTLQLKRRADGWTAAMAKDVRPYVLSSEAVQKGVMPPEGCSALPPSLESVVPYAFRYWTMKGEEAKAARDALVSTSLFAEGIIKVVDGEHRLCVSRLFLYEPDEAELGKAEWSLPDPGPTEPAYMFKCERCDVAAEVALEILVSKGAKPAAREYELACRSCATKALVSADEPDPVTKAVTIEEAFAANEDSIVGKTVRVTADTGENAVGKVLAEAEGNALVLFDDGERRMVARHRCSEPSDSVAKGLLPVSLRAKACSSSPYATEPMKPHERYGAADSKARAKTKSKLAGAGDIPAPDPLTKFLTTEHSVRLAMAKADDAKAKTEERFVYGIVLEPETIDAQQDIYSPEEIRNAAHAFMEKFRTIGLMHKGAINDKVKILESFIAPADFEVEGAPVKAGTWVMAVKVLDDDLWTAIKSGDMTGFSIGGSAIRKPDTSDEAAA